MFCIVYTDRELIKFNENSGIENRTISYLIPTKFAQTNPLLWSIQIFNV